MTTTLTAETLLNAVKPDRAQRLLRRIADRIEERFRLPLIFGEKNHFIIQPWTMERIAVHVIDRGDHTGDMKVLVIRETRNQDAEAESGFSDWFCEWPSDPENSLQTWHWGNPEDRLDTGTNVADDVSSFLTEWLTRSRADHLIR